MARETKVQSQFASYQRLKKMVLDTSLLNTQYYKVYIKGKVEQSGGRSSTLPYTSVVANFTLIGILETIRLQTIDDGQIKKCN